MPGTLELTWWPAKRRLCFKIQSTRAAWWMNELLPTLKSRL